jgi:uncharacterized repeat protein (TIGR03809 family)
MTHLVDAARGRDILERWCALAEQRLDYLTEMFESGRWRRYHSEASFLENIREARTALDIWRDLSVREASRDNSAVDVSWLGRSRGAPPRREPPGQTHRPQPQLPEITAAPPLADVSIAGAVADAPVIAHSEPILDLVKPASKPALKKRDVKPVLEPSLDDAPALTLDIAVMQQRYPLLRNAML